MPHEPAGPPELAPHQRLDLRIVSDDGVHALRTQLQQVDPATGRPCKRRFGPWLLPVLRGLARLKGLRGTALDPFGWMAERRAEKALKSRVYRYSGVMCPPLAFILARNWFCALSAARVQRRMSASPAVPPAASTLPASEVACSTTM